MGGVRLSQNRSRSFGLPVAAILLGSLLGGCSSMPSMPSFASVFGSGTAAGDSNASALASAPHDFECPGIVIRHGASTLTSTSDGQEQNALNLRYQVGFGQTARECRVSGNMVSIKVGVQGRVIMGPAGAPGTIDVPLRFAVVHEGIEPKPIVTKLERLSVNVAPGNTNVLFTHVEDSLTFPMPPGADIDSYVVYVGFDPIAAREQDRRRAPPRQAPPRRTQPRQQS
jgi:hypothetical protein